MRKYGWMQSAQTIFALAVTLSIAWCGRTAAQLQPKKKTELRVLPLRYVDATEVAEVVKNLFGKDQDGGCQVAANQSTNSLIIRAAPATLTAVMKLVMTLDSAERTAQPRLETNIFELRHITPNDSLIGILKLYLGEDGRYAFDAKRNALVVQASAKAIKALEAVLQRLDRPQTSQPRLKIRVVWLAAGKTTKKLMLPPPDLKNVVEQLAKIGVEDPRMVTQMVVNAELGAEFRSNGSTNAAGEDLEVSIQGKANLRQADIDLNIKIEVTKGKEIGLNPGVGLGSCNLQTSIIAPVGHTVLLGVTPSADTTSIFAVQIYSK